MRGMCDASGADFDKVRRIHMMGELTKGACSMFGAWGGALPGGNGLITMRALDWDMEGPFKDFPELTVYHAAPNSTENSFVNVGWTGWLGSISGVNDQHMSIHEIGVSYADDTFGEESDAGIPFTYVLRDILQFDKSQADGVARLQNAARTCKLILGVGGAGPNDPTPTFNSIQYSYSVCNVMNDTTMMPDADWHARIPNMVYYGMDWLCPNYDKVLRAQLLKYNGQLTPEAAIRDIMPIVQTGDLHVYVANLPSLDFYVAHARRSDGQGPVNAYDRPYIHLKLGDLFAVPPPTAPSTVTV